MIEYYNPEQKGVIEGMEQIDMKLKDDRKKIVCKKCGRIDFISNMGLKNHITKGHKMSVSVYERKYGKITT